MIDVAEMVISKNNNNKKRFIPVDRSQFGPPTTQTVLSNSHRQKEPHQAAFLSRQCDIYFLFFHGSQESFDKRII
jgi:hypothetical protein